MTDAQAQGLITQANARLNAAKSHEVRRKNREAARLELEALRKAVIFAPTHAATAVELVQEMDNSRAAARTEKQMQRIDELTQEAEQQPAANWDEQQKRAQVLDRLSAAKDRLFKQWCILAGVPMPGKRADVPAKKSRNQAAFQPPAPVESSPTTADPAQPNP